MLAYFWLGGVVLKRLHCGGLSLYALTLTRCRWFSVGETTSTLEWWVYLVIIVLCVCIIIIIILIALICIRKKNAEKNKVSSSHEQLTSSGVYGIVCTAPWCSTEWRQGHGHGTICTVPQVL